VGPTRNVAVGLFVAGGIALFGLGLFLIGDRKRLFEDSFVVFAEFERLAGLQDGARVRVAGLGAGEVLSISFPQSPEAKFRVEMRVIEDLHPLVRTDSVALIQGEGLVGSQLVEIGAGSESAPKVEEGGTIDSREPFEMADLMAKASDVAETLSTTIVSVGDQPTVAAALAAKALGLPHNPPEATAACRNKFRARELLRAAGLRVPRFARFPIGGDPDPREIVVAVGFPCVLKPLCLSASRGDSSWVSICRVSSAAACA